jgi:peroxin-1
LTTNTEVSVAPKLSRNKQVPSKQLFNGMSATSAGNSPATGTISQSPQLPSQILRVLPLRVAPPVQFPKSSGSESFAFVSPHTFSRLYPSRGGDRSLQFLKTNLKCLARPTDPLRPTLPSSPSPDLATRPPNSGGSEMGLDEINKPGTINDVYIGIMKQLPANHIVFLNLPDGVEEWDLLRLIPNAICCQQFYLCALPLLAARLFKTVRL